MQIPQNMNELTEVLNTLLGKATKLVNDMKTKADSLKAAKGAEQTKETKKSEEMKEIKEPEVKKDETPPTKEESSSTEKKS